MRFCMSILCVVAITGILTAQTASLSAPLPLGYESTAVYLIADTESVRRAETGFRRIGIQRGPCKSITYLYEEVSSPVGVTTHTKQTPHVLRQNAGKPLLKVHGNIYYDLFYQSNIDTPYTDRGLQQHTVRTYLTIMVKDNYPLRLTFAGKFSNSGLLKDFTGLGIMFNANDFKKQIESRARSYVIQQAEQAKAVDSLRSLISETASQLDELRKYLESPIRPQALTAAKENLTDSIVSAEPPERTQFPAMPARVFMNRFLSPPMAPAYEKKSVDGSAIATPPSQLTQLEKEFDSARKQYDSLLKEFSRLNEAKRKAESDAVQFAANNLFSQSTPGEVYSALRQVHLPDSVLPKGYKKLLALRSLGIGRTTVDFSELTVKNLTIKGLQVEYNPSWYLAFATGVIDYQFRNFIVADAGRPKQYMNVFRAGRGMKEGNNIIVSFFHGRKQLYNSAPANGNEYNIAGFTVESRWQVEKNTFVAVEFGKSSLPYFRRANKDGLVQSALNFAHHSNQAYSVKLASYLPKTLTRINAMYRHTGADYQCFSYYTSNSNQTAWSLKLEQPFFKRIVNITAFIRKNDFVSPYVSTSHQSNTIFKSAQATVHARKWPIVSIGYFPSSQLIKLNDEVLAENFYYTLTANVSHHYKLKGKQMNSLFSFIRFCNQTTDTGFVYFNTKNYNLSHFMHLGKVTLQFSLAETVGINYNLCTAGGNMQFRLKQWLQAGGGIKYNNQTVVNEGQMGYTMNANISVAGIGTIQFYAEKAFIPSASTHLVENKIGRLTFIKTF